MKRLVGGDYQLDLSPIEIEESVDGETYTSITDKSVLDQLTDLKSFIGKSGMIKPVWIKLLNGETDELIVTRGSLSTSDGVTFLIKVLLAGFILTLSVEFTQAETDDHTPLDEWYIDSNDAKYILVSDAQSLAQQLADFEGDASITGDVGVTGDVDVDGDFTADSIVEKMTGYSAGLGGSDAEATIENVYSSAVKTGNKLTCVAYLKVKRLTTLTVNYRTLIKFFLPEDIMDKLYPISESGSLASVLVISNGVFFKDLIQANMKNVVVTVYKVLDGIQMTAEDLSGLDANEDYYVRVEQTFLLSDNMI